MHNIARTLACLLFVALSAFNAPVQANGAQLQIDPQHSSLTVYVSKQGIFAFAADNHVVNAPLTSGAFDPAAKSIELKIDAAQMRVLDPSMSPGRRAQVQANMVSSQVLDVQKYPEVTFHSTKTEATSPGKLKVTGDLTLHGQTRSVTVDVDELDAKHYKGTATIRQTDFGITPIRIAGGTVKVKDELRVEFDIELK